MPDSQFIPDDEVSQLTQSLVGEEWEEERVGREGVGEETPSGLRGVSGSLFCSG